MAGWHPTSNETQLQSELETAGIQPTKRTDDEDSSASSPGIGCMFGTVTRDTASLDNEELMAGWYPTSQCQHKPVSQVSATASNTESDPTKPVLVRRSWPAGLLPANNFPGLRAIPMTQGEACVTSGSSLLRPAAVARRSAHP